MPDLFDGLSLDEATAMRNAVCDGQLDTKLLSLDRYVALYDAVNSVTTLERVEGCVHNYNVFEFFDDVLTFAVQWHEELIREHPEYEAQFGGELYTHDGPNVPHSQFNFEAPESYVNAVLPTIASATLFSHEHFGDEGLSTDDMQRYIQMFDPILHLMAESTRTRIFKSFDPNAVYSTH